MTLHGEPGSSPAAPSPGGLLRRLPLALAASVPPSNAAVEWTWVVGRSIAAAAMAIGAAVAVPGSDLLRWAVGLAACVTLYNAMLSMMLVRGELRKVTWAGVALDTAAFGAGCWMLTVAQAGGVISTDLYVLIAFPAMLVATWRLGWAMGLAFLGASLAWIVLATLRYFPSGEATAQLPWRLFFLVLTTVLAARLVQRLASERREGNRLRRDIDALTRMVRVAFDRHGAGANIDAVWSIVSDAIPFDRISIARIDVPHGTTEEAYVFPGSAGPAVSGILSGTAAEDIVRTRRGLLADPFGPILKERSGQGPLSVARGLRSFLCVPVLWQGRVVGLLTLAANAARTYDSTRLDLAHRIASVLAPPIVDVLEPVEKRQPDSPVDTLSLTKRELVYAVAHHLRTPMTAIQVATEMLTNEVFQGDYPAQLRQKVNLLRSGVGRLEILVGDSLEYVAATQRATVLEKVEVDLVQLLRRVIDSFESTLYARHHRVIWVQQDEPATCFADPIHLDRCLIHLVGLAAQITPDGEEITMRLTRPARKCTLEISTGRWRRKVEQLDAMFVAKNPVARDPAPAAGTAGMFLGFAIARAIAEAHGGSLEVEERTDGGTMFRLQVEAPPDRPRVHTPVVAGAAVP